MFDKNVLILIFTHFRSDESASRTDSRDPSSCFVLIRIFAGLRSRWNTPIHTNGIR
jgi:hypothetical protein